MKHITRFLFLAAITAILAYLAASALLDALGAYRVIAG